MGVASHDWPPRRAVSYPPPMRPASGGQMPQRSEISAIVAARAVACLLVVYCHAIGRPIVVYNETWAAHTLISSFVAEPLGIIRNFGLFGVALFFFISG